MTIPIHEGRPLDITGTSTGLRELRIPAGSGRDIARRLRLPYVPSDTTIGEAVNASYACARVLDLEGGLDPAMAVAAHIWADEVATVTIQVLAEAAGDRDHMDGALSRVTRDLIEQAWDAGRTLIGPVLETCRYISDSFGTIGEEVGPVMNPRQPLPVHSSASVLQITVSSPTRPLVTAAPA